MNAQELNRLYELTETPKECVFIKLLLSGFDNHIKQLVKPELKELGCEE